MNWNGLGLPNNVYFQDKDCIIYCADCREVLPSIHGVSAVVTDPPYELGFMGKKWDGSGISFQKDIWQLIRGVCLPGAMLLSFGGTRTSHRIACAIEDAEWQIRDTICWVYGSGFPKSLDISKAIDKQKGAKREVIGHRPIAYPDSDCWGIPNKNSSGENPNPSSYKVPTEKNGGNFGGMRNITAPVTPEAKLWEGYGTALKPAYEPIIVAMNPLDGTFADNALKHKVAGLNIDKCRIGLESHSVHGKEVGKFQPTGGQTIKDYHEVRGRFPANFIHDGSQEVMELFPQTKASKYKPPNARFRQGHSLAPSQGMSNAPDNYGDSGSAARFFYCAKSSRSERNIGLDNNITVKYNVSNEGALCKDEIMVAVQLLPKVILGLTAQWNKDGSGESITVRFHRDISSTILTEISKIIELKTLPLLMHSLTSGYIQDANGLMVNGGSLAESVGRLKEYLLTITNGNRELALGASRVVLEMLLKTSVKENWHENYNFHATVKPLALMTYLCKLVKMPEYNLILDPFCGSGSTLLACKKLGIPCIGIDSNEEYCEIAKKRLSQDV